MEFACSPTTGPRSGPRSLRRLSASAAWDGDAHRRPRRATATPPRTASLSSPRCSSPASRSRSCWNRDHSACRPATPRPSPARRRRSPDLLEGERVTPSQRARRLHRAPARAASLISRSRISQEIGIGLRAAEVGLHDVERGAVGAVVQERRARLHRVLVRGRILRGNSPWSLTWYVIFDAAFCTEAGVASSTSSRRPSPRR